MKPPPFRVPEAPFEAQRYLARARQFRSVASNLPDLDNGQPLWPKYFLITHAIELALKAFSRSRDAVGVRGEQELANHDLIGWYDYAVQRGLQRDDYVANDLKHLSELHEIHYARYPQDAAKPVALISQYDDMVDRIIANVSKAIELRP